MRLVVEAVGVSWFPQEYAQMFYIIKTVLGIAATGLLVFHMTIAWTYIVEHGTMGQRLRYYSLLACAFIIAGSSVEQYHDDIVVSYRNLAGMALVILIIIAMIVSLKEDHRRFRSDKS